jgi:hypothetical protein
MPSSVSFMQNVYIYTTYIIGMPYSQTMSNVDTPYKKHGNIINNRSVYQSSPSKSYRYFGTMKLLALAILAVLPSGSYSVDVQFGVCSNATVIPSTPVFPYVTNYDLDFSLDCFPVDDDDGLYVEYGCPSFWYSWIPDASGSYDFRVAIESTSAKIELGIYQGSKCDLLNYVDFGSQNEIVSSTVEVEAGTKYFFNFTLNDYDIQDPSKLTFSLDRTPVRPANDECVGAIVVNPLMDEVVIGNVTNALREVDLQSISSCYVDTSPGIWYKIDNWTHSELGVLLSIPSKVVEGDCVLSAAIRVFNGTDCGNLECVGRINRFYETGYCDATTYGFLPSAFSTYYILVQGIIQDTFPLSVSTFSATPPQNVKCNKPIVIPSAPTFPYTSMEVNIGLAKIDPAYAQSTCDDHRFNVNFRKVWYEWSPDVSGHYPFGATSSFTYSAIFEGAGCYATNEVYCGYDLGTSLFAVRYNSFYLTAGKKYHILITYHGGFGEFYPLALTIGAPISTPPNAECDGAISLNPISDKIAGDTVNATYKSIRTCIDRSQESSKDFGLWYEMENMSNDTLSVSVSVCGEGEKADHGISVYQGDNCRNLKCIARFDPGLGCGDSAKLFFFVSPATKYYFYIAARTRSINSKFTLTVDGSPSFLTLINAQTDTAIALLGTTPINYRKFPTSKLNILATFGSDITVSSVRMTFNNPNRNFCEKYAPYAVFGDSKGDFFNATIPLGTHLATATPYAQAGCQGPAGISVAKNFTVGPGCAYSFYGHNTGSVWYAGQCSLGFGDSRAFTSVKIPALPCNVNIEYRPSCGFDVQVVRMTLRNAVTNAVVHDVIDREKPFFLFDTQTANYTSEFPTFTAFAASNSSIAPGSYILTPFIDGIQHPDLKLFVGNKTACNACVPYYCWCRDIKQY